MPPLKDGLKLGGSLLRLPNESWRPILTMGAVTPAKADVLNGLGEASALLCATMIGRPMTIERRSPQSVRVVALRCGRRREHLGNRKIGEERTRIDAAGGL